MIKINNLHKYFNKRKSNEIHVINNTTLEFQTSGLVCLLGNSGSGKTTLLNVIGGLDKVDSGLISIDDNNISKYNASKWDDIRNRHFGYIFQNYILLPELTVHQNLEFVLKMLNVSKEEIEERIEYALKAVGMEKYKKRKPTQLSGGQQQRIAIARALVKSPKVIIADEPTGNLDEKNTTQIMNIIKKISKECLVILVTHERRLADFYGDRIIEIADGQVISDNIISSTGSFLQMDNTNIYLQEFNKDEYKNDNVNIKYFYQEEKKDIDLNIIFKDNTFFIQSKLENVKIKFIDKSNEIKVIDSKKPVISPHNIDEFDYHLKPIEQGNQKNKSVIKFTDTLKMAISHLNGLKKRQKLLFVTMFLSTIMITIGLLNLFNSRSINENDYVYYNKNTIQLFHDDDDFINLLDEDDYIIVDPDNSVASEFTDLSFNQTNYVNTTLSYRYNSNSVISLKVIENPNLILGRMPTNRKEALIDKTLVDKYIDSSNFSSVGLKHLEQFIGLKFVFGSRYSYNQLENNSYEIVGIVDNNNHNIYINDDEYKLGVIGIGQEMNYYDLDYLTINMLSSDEKVFLLDEEGNPAEQTTLDDIIVGDDEILMSYNLYNSLAPIISDKNVLLFSKTYKIAGLTGDADGSERQFIVSEETADELYKESINFLTRNRYPSSYFIHSFNKDELLEKFAANGYRAIDLHQRLTEEYKETNQDIELYISSLFVLIASLVFLFLLMRSSMMQRIYQIGVYRALGVKKINVHKIFITEIFFITLITTVLGIGVVHFTITQINSFVEVIKYPWFISPLAFASILIVNILVGSLPVAGLLRLTPSQILSKYDI